MHHFAFTHSLTLADAGGVPAKMVLFLSKQGGAPRPCHWLRVGKADFPEAIKLGRTLLSERINVAVVIAKAELTDRAIVASLSETLSSEGLGGCELLARPEPLSLRGAA